MNDSHLISIREACRRTSLSRTQINALRKQERFPVAVPLGEKRIAFVASEVDGWIASRIAERDRRAA